MTIVDFIGCVAIPLVIAFSVTVLFIIEILTGISMMKPKKAKCTTISEPTSRPEDDYLVVCRTKKYAMELRKRLLHCVSGCYLGNEIKVINNYGKFICLYFTRTHTTVRFISEAGYYEASKGFRGWIVEENQLEEWLDAAEVSNES